MEFKLEAISLLFILSTITIILIPGQDMFLIMSRAITQGKKAGIITTLGVSIGLMGHTLLATLGLGALLATNEWIFNIIKIVGALYLIYLGYQLLTSNEHKFNTKELVKISYRKMFLQGILSNISNPKVAIFYFSYLPQFIVFDGSNSESLQLFLLGATYAILTFFMKAPIGLISGTLSFWIKARPIVLKYINRVSGTILIVLGLKLITEQRN